MSLDSKYLPTDALLVEKLG